MADQARWFKLWVSAPSDDDLQRLEPCQRWAWAVFGCYTKLHGTHGTVAVSPRNVVLAAEMGVTVDALIPTIRSLPHVTVRETGNHHGALTVTWNNWVKYQEDSTQAERQRTSRAKKRGEEIRREEKRTLPPVVPHGGPDLAILEFLNQKTGKHFRAKPTNLSPIRARLADGIADWQLRAIISRKTHEWRGTERELYLRPATLFNKTKCEQYLGELPAETTDA